MQRWFSGTYIYITCSPRWNYEHMPVVRHARLSSVSCIIPPFNCWYGSPIQDCYRRTFIYEGRRHMIYMLWEHSGSRGGWGWHLVSHFVCPVKVRGKVDGMAKSGMAYIVPRWIWFHDDIFPYSTRDFFLDRPRNFFWIVHYIFFWIDHGSINFSYGLTMFFLWIDHGFFLDRPWNFSGLTTDCFLVRPLIFSESTMDFFSGSSIKFSSGSTIKFSSSCRKLWHRCFFRTLLLIVALLFRL